MTVLDHLASLAGIEESYWDIFGNFHETKTEAKLSILSAMGFNTDSEQALAIGLVEFEELSWRRILEPVYVVRHSRGEITICISLPEILWGEKLRWEIMLEDGNEMSGAFHPAADQFQEIREIDAEPVARFSLQLPQSIPHGYHRLSIEARGSPSHCSLIVTPQSAYAPPWLKEAKRLWGIACHLYALRSENNWGIGDFSDLTDLIRITHDCKGSAVGINPLHSLFPLQPEHASPYSPSSRLFLNPLYIDLSREPEFQNSHEIRAIVKSEKFIDQLTLARDANHVDYPRVCTAKLAMLEHMHGFFSRHHPPGATEDPRRADFDAFVKEGGEALHHFSLFQTLHEHFEGIPWSHWPEDYQRPDSNGSVRFAQAHQRRLEFHSYLQWLAERQLASTAQACTDAGMEVGLYMDLAVGASPDGADTWSSPEAISQGARFGAPPDDFNAQGQDWGMPPFHPHKLKEQAYTPFISMLRANMRHAGALRIDHVVGLMRLYWIPPGEEASQGAYVRYPFDDLLGILALESVRNRCLVIGEDLGTVPEGFRQRMAMEGALSYQVMRFERYADGLFKRPDTYPALSLATSATHDLSTLKGYWLGSDLLLRRALGLYQSDEQEQADNTARAQDRELLIAAMKDQGLLPEPFPCSESDEEQTVRRLTIAVERFLARCQSQLLKVNLDDLLLEAEQLNVPGTVEEYPNWRRKNAIPLEDLMQIPFVREVIQAITSER